MNRIVFAGGASALLLAGCSILPKSEPLDIYRLTAPVPATVMATRTFGAPTVMISLPSANRALGGNDIMVAQDDSSLAVAAGTRWAAPARNLVQDYIIETFENAAPTLAPLRPGDGISGDYDLSIDLRHFEAEYDNGDGAAPVVHVSIGARMISAARKLEGATVLSADARARSNTMRDIVAAFDAATGQVANALAEWTVQGVQAAEQRIAAEERAAAAARRRGPDVSVDVDVDIDGGT